MQTVKKIAFYLLLTIFIQCSKPKIQINYLTDYAKTFAAFQIGSYWIYQNDSSLLIDSIYSYLVKKDFELHERDGNIDSKTEQLSLTLKSNLKPTDLISFELEANYDPVKSYGVYYLGKWSIAFYFINNTVSINSQAQNIGLLSQNIIYYPNLSINGTTFNSIYEIDENVLTTDSTILYDREKIFIESNVGLIKWNVHYKDSSSESWSLLRYHIVM